MFNSYLLNEKEQLQERVINRLKIKKGDCLSNDNLGFDWFKYFHNPLNEFYIEKDIKDFLLNDEEIVEAEIIDIKNQENKLIIDLKINSIPLKVETITNEK